MIFVNLPVSDLDKSKAFYEAVGAANNPAFTDETAACMVVEEGSIHVMLLTHEKWATFTSKTIPDARTTAQVLLCVSADSREEVDGQVDKAVKAGGKADPTPTQEYGDFMYGRSFEDPDGHIWEVMWMDPTAIPTDAPAEATA
jgi:hypothetical protein